MLWYEPMVCDNMIICMLKICKHCVIIYRICNGHGTIQNGSCVCSPGYMGIDCTIEANQVNRVIYDDTDSVSIYVEEVCNSGIFSYSEDDQNLGIFSISINVNYLSLKMVKLFKK